MKFSQFSHIPLSPTMAMNERAMIKQKQGEPVYNLSAGEPMINTADVVVDAAYRAMKKGETHYAPLMGISALRDVFVEWMNRTYHTSYLRDEVIVTTGGKHALYSIVEAMINPGDEAIVIAPYWVSYMSMVSLQGGTAVVVDTSEHDGWKISLEKLETAIHDNTKILFLNNAGNPTGVLYARDELEAIVALCASRGVLLVSDEVYSGLVYDSHEFFSAGSFEQYRDNVCVVQSCSKHFAMTGWRVGFACGPTALMETLKILQSQSTSGTSTISQWAALTAIEHADEIITHVRDTMVKRRNTFVDTFNAHFHHPLSYPGASLYCFIPLSTFGIQEQSSLAFCLDVLEQYNVALVPGSAFGMEGYVRASFGVNTTDIVDAVQKLATFYVS